MYESPRIWNNRPSVLHAASYSAVQLEPVEASYESGFDWRGPRGDGAARVAGPGSAARGGPPRGGTPRAGQYDDVLIKLSRLREALVHCWHGPCPLASSTPQAIGLGGGILAEHADRVGARSSRPSLERNLLL